MIENGKFKKLMTEFTGESDTEDKGERRDISWCPGGSEQAGQRQLLPGVVSREAWAGGASVGYG